MDTKLKDKPKRASLGGWTALVLILLLSAVIVCMVPLLAVQARVKYQNPLEEDVFLSQLGRMSYILSQELKSKAQAEPQQKTTEIDGPFQNKLNIWSENTKSDFINIEYLAIGPDGAVQVSSSASPLDLALSDRIEDQAALKKLYQYYVVLNYQQDGEISMQRLYGADSEKTRKKLWILNDLAENEDSVSSLAPYGPKDMTVVYAIAHELKINDAVSKMLKTEIYYSYVHAGSNFLFLLMYGIAALAAILLGSARAGRFYTDGGPLARLPCEVLLTVLVILVYSVWGNTARLMQMADGTLSARYALFIQSIVAREMLVFLTNFLIWAFCIGFIFCIAAAARRFFEMGPQAYLRRHSLLVRFWRWLSDAIYRKLTETDISAHGVRTIRRLILVNTIAVAMIGALWVFGLALLLPYTALLYCLAVKYAGRVQEDYRRVLTATQEMAVGNLDVDLENIRWGTFEALRGSLCEIRSGFRVAVEEETRSQRMKTELITNVSHDLKTPLTAIISYVDLLKDETISCEQRAAYLITLDQKSQRLKTLIEDLFEVSKANSGNVKLDITAVDLVALVKQTGVELQESLDASGLELRYHLPLEKLILPLDSTKMFRVFENLYGNIVKYAQRHSRVYIEMTVHGSNVAVVLKNISAAELNASDTDLTERFARGEKARNTEGSGLGLAIVRSFVELQGGVFSVETDGDLFKATVSFPLPEGGVQRNFSEI